MSTDKKGSVTGYQGINVERLDQRNTRIDHQGAGAVTLGKFISFADPVEFDHSISPLFSVKRVAVSSPVVALEAALAVQTGKSTPAGYDQAARFFRSDYGSTSAAMCVWLMAEATQAGLLDKMRQEFPQVEGRAVTLVEHMERSSQETLDGITRKVHSPDYGYSGRLELAEAIALLEPVASRPEELPRVLDRLVGVGPSSHRLGTVTTALTQPQILFTLIDGILADDALKDGLNARSYQLVGQDNDGRPTETFHTLVLARGASIDPADSPWNTAIHLWFPEQGPYLMDEVHTHSRPFASTVMTGAFRDVISRRTSDGSGEEMLVYGSPTPEPTDVTHLVSLPERVVPAGRQHRVTTDFIHHATVDPGEGLVATVSVRGPRRRSVAEVFRSEPRIGDDSKNVSIDAAESLQRFRNALAT